MKAVAEPIAALAVVWATFVLAALGIYRLHFPWFPMMAMVSCVSWGVAIVLLREHPHH